jgi:hypothetical protein
MTVQDTLAEREQQHGPFLMHAHIEFEFRCILEKYSGHLPPYQKIAAGMILHKLARILNKGNMHADTWHDIAGYATLAERELE